MPDVEVIWRLAKLVAVAVTAAGVGAATLTADPEARRRGLTWTTLGFLATGATGYRQLKQLGLELDAPWVLAGLFLGLASVAGTAWSTLREGSGWARGVALGGLVAAVGAMVAQGGAGLGLPTGLGLLVGGLGARGATAPPAAPPRAWFLPVARAEGTSLLLLLGVVVPLERGLGIEVDPAGLVGWVHGQLVLIYLVALAIIARAERWSVGRTTLAFVASLLPFGTFAFERHLHRTAP